VAITNNQTVFDSLAPIAGNYTFAIQSPTSNQNVVVTFPPGPQPAPLNVSNFAASQAIITNQEFTLTWAAVVGGTATDFILVDVGLVGLSSPDYGTVGALTGQSTSFVIPAGTLGPNSTYDATLSFYRFNASTNVGSKLSTSAALVTRTLITLKTAGGSVQPVPPTLSNFQLTGGHFQFQVSASPGQTVIIDRATAPTGGSWQPFQTNTLSAAPLIVSDPVIAGETRFFRARSP
jgi:hypothetical protein